ncbi:MAG: beta-hydroxyacyl-ACP dehydratase [Pirellulales bacterium]|nr:beta-hydroxyacyl-ACP dehydratase [Pirellulales bacterium]
MSTSTESSPAQTPSRRAGRQNVAGKDLIFDIANMTLDTVIAGPDEIRRYNPQRDQFEYLSGILHEDTEKHACIGFHDVTENESWVSGHMPGKPIMPGVLICEAAAQLSSYFSQKFNLLDCKMVGLGGMTDVHFRGLVRPGDRLVVAVQRIKCSPRRMIVCRWQAFVRNEMVANGIIKGVPLPEDIPALKAKD